MVVVVGAVEAVAAEVGQEGLQEDVGTAGVVLIAGNLSNLPTSAFGIHKALTHNFLRTPGVCIQSFKFFRLLIRLLVPEI